MLVNNEWKIIIVSSRSQTNTLSSSFSGGELVDNDVGEEDKWCAEICNCCGICCCCCCTLFNIWLFRFDFFDLPFDFGEWGDVGILGLFEYWLSFSDKVAEFNWYVCELNKFDCCCCRAAAAAAAAAAATERSATDSYN